VPSTNPQALQQAQGEGELSEEARQRLDRLAGRTEDMNARLGEVAQEVSSLRQTLKSQEQESQKQLQELEKRLARLEKALQQVQGSTRVNGKEIDRMSDQLMRVYSDWGGRLEQVEEQQNLLLDRLQEEGLELGQGAGQDNETARQKQQQTQAQPDDKTGEDEPLSATAPPKQPPKPQQPSAEEREKQRKANEARQAYQEAFQLVKDGEYQKAREALRKFLGNYPGSQYADNAQYWLGETYYVMGEYENALEEFQNVAEKYPKSSKVPAAKLKTGYSYYELEDYRQARKQLIGVMDSYPDHRVADLAKEQLETIRKEQF
jgi:tol-pal system protein YbgF